MKKYYNKVSLFSKIINFSFCLTNSKKNSLTEENAKKLLYIHGCSFVKEAISFQMKFTLEISKNTNSTLIFPVYSLVPKCNYITMYDLTDKLYNKLLIYPREKIFKLIM